MIEFKFHSRTFARLGALLLLTATAACAHTDDYPMHNQTTGQTVMCHSGLYWLSEDADDRRIAEQCIASCTSHGFNLIPKDAVGPKNALDGLADTRSETPTECMP